MSGFGARLEWLLRWLGIDVERLPYVPARVVRRRGDDLTHRRRVLWACAGCALIVACAGALALH